MVRKKKKDAEKAPITSQKVECRLRKVREYGSVLPEWNPEITKLGRYSGSRWEVIPRNRYPVLAYIEGNFEDLTAQGDNPEDIISACVNFLNTPPPRKKFARRTPKPLYGNLRLVKYTCRRGEAGMLYFEVIMSTEQKKNRHFWGVGI
jgi:hypothetical protein